MSAATHTPTAYEQELLELINRARLAPEDEFDALIANAASGQAVQSNITTALDYFGVDLDSFRAQLSGLDPTAPLAWNGALADAATSHSEEMISHDTQSHQLPGELSLGDRVTAAGYDGWTTVFENVFAYGEDAVYTHAGFFIDWGYDATDFSGGSLRSNWQSVGDGIQDPAGHRIAILSEDATEVGISAIHETSSATTVGDWVVTQNFGTRSDYVPQLLGVVIDDADGDNFYDQGEGLGGITITASGANGVYTTTSWSSGGYQMVLPDGSYQVMVWGEGLNGIAIYDVVMAGENLKLDIEADDAQPRDIATAGDDVLMAGGGSLDLAGLAGQDTLLGSAGDDVLAGDTMPLTLSDWGDEVFRLYGATLGRTPDVAGYESWINSLSSGAQSLMSAAQGFVGSREFQTAYGALDDAGFVTLLYQNVLGRDPDASGLATWTSLLAGGAAQSSIVLGLSESAEYKRGTDAAAEAYAEGLSAAGWSDDVFRLYQATLDRAPDAGGFASWVTALAAGRALTEVATGFVASTEFDRVYGPLDDAGFVGLLYQNVLDRVPDAAGLADWTGQLAGGATRADVVLGFSQSGEFQSATAAALADYMKSLGGGDTLDGGAGNDILSGGLYADTFVFGVGDGSDRVVDFEAWDQVDLSELGYGSVTEALSHASQSGADVVFADQGVTVVFEDTTLAAFADTLLIG